jgi:cephalosporin hydroxylase
MGSTEAELVQPPSQGRPIEHYWDELPGPCWFSATEIYRRQAALARHGAVFVEVGAWKGRSTVFMAVEIIKSGKAISFFTVDHWLGSDAAHKHDEDLKNGRLFDVFSANIAPVAHRVEIIQDYSVNAARRFADGSVDFVYVDAGHKYDDVSSDLAAWWPKVRPGGVMAGDDRCFIDPKTKEPSVRRAVEEFFAKHRQDIRIEDGMPNRGWEQWVVVMPNG